MTRGPLTAFARLAMTAIFPTIMTCATDARAETPPSIWDRAKDPDALPRYELHLHAEVETMRGASNTMLRELGAHRALAMLEQAHVEDTPDVALRIDLGRVYESTRNPGRAAEVLSKALALDPNNPAATQGWYALALANARLDRPEEEIRTYEKYLALETNDEYRASTVANIAEAEMRQGRLRAAIDGYRDAIRMSEEIRTQGAVQTYVLAIWGLCVALDRNGDSTGALIEANRAVSHDPQFQFLNADNVFFVPEYERFYYQGMGELAIASGATTDREKAEHYDKAERRFREYVADATDDDRWLTRARAHLKLAESKLPKTKNPGVARDPSTRTGATPKELHL